ncbi:MAG TPA: GNAT family N-acetyltransferase [Casimicrobium huifangae]|nr:GNAT family N-acetyltransferase [Casimicrobium huifangae]
MKPFADVALLTPRLRLRPLAIIDAESLYGIYSDPEFMRYWSSAPWTSIDQATQLIERDLRELPAGEHLRLGIFLRDGDALIGTCSLFHLSAQCRRGEVGYGIARPHWRKGYMFEAVSALIGFAFGELNLHRLEADIDPRNAGSARSLEKLGFIREGLLRERWIVGDEVSDSALYGLLARDWRHASLTTPDPESRCADK